MTLTLDVPLIASAEHWFEQTLSSRWTPLVANVAALALVSYSAAQWTWRLLPGGAPPPPATATAPAVRAPAFDLQSVLAAQLFGHAESAAQRPLPPTSLNVVLSGVIMRGYDSFALVSVDSAPEIAVAAGQDLVPGVRLQAVLADRVVLERGGALEHLLLKEPDAKLPPGAITTAPSGPAAVRSDAPNRFAVGREALNKQMQSPEFLSQALMVPNAGGGFLVRQIQTGSLYERLGLRVGDVIRSVNGQPINNMDEVMRVYQQLGGAGQAGSISVEVMRAGRSEQLQYQIE